MANSWLACLVILASLGSVITGEKPVVYNVVSAEEFQKQTMDNPDSHLLRVAYFWKFDTLPGGRKF